MKKRKEKLKKSICIKKHKTFWKSTFVVTMVIMFLLSPRAFCQSEVVSIKITNGSIEDVLKKIKQQTGLKYLFNHEQLKKQKEKKISINVEKSSVEKVLKQCLKNTELTYEIIDNTIVIKPKTTSNNQNKKISGITQTIRGKIIDKESKIPLTGANIIVQDTDPIIGSTSYIDGDFRLKNVPVGRHALKVTYIGYQEQIIPEIAVGSAKEVILTISLTEKITKLDEVVVSPYKKGSPKNDMAAVSARSFSVEESQRYAGSLGDPGRMAWSFAGANSDDDLSNQIVIRGNSPNSMLWRLEGVEIPIPNHFYTEGESAGYVSLLSSNMMGQSDFFTGAFPAEYGNSTSGVFDITFRNGNNEKREYTIDVGTLGLNFSTEGPIKKDYKGSYLVNYRYATFSILNWMGLEVIDDNPDYTDLSYKFYLPTKKAGSFSIWGLAGLGSMLDEFETSDTIDSEVITVPLENKFRSTSLSTGITHTYFPDSKSYFKTIVSFSGNSSFEEMAKSGSSYDHQEISFTSTRFSISYDRKFTSKLNLKTGLVYSLLSFSYFSKYLDEDNVDQNTWIEELQGNGNTVTLQGFIQSKILLSRKLNINLGLHYLKFNFIDEQSFEPRIGFQYKLNNAQSINGGFGMHSRHDYLIQYYYIGWDENGLKAYPNRNLTLQKSTHYVLGYTNMIKKDLKFQAEIYYQDLSGIPVSPDSSYTFSPINDDVVGYAYVSKGVGRNYGIEFTLEKFFTNNYYFLVTSSLFSAKYKPLNGIWYNTRYNNNYVINISGGKEFVILKNNILGINGRFIWSGGRRATPFDEAMMYLTGEERLDQSQRNMVQFSPYIRPDLGIYFKVNLPSVSHEFAINIQNVINKYNVIGYWDIVSDEPQEQWLQGILPIVSYKLHF
jgi:hypothetical protein